MTTEGWEATVLRVLDGDTLDVFAVGDTALTPTRVRIVGIDAPELPTSRGKRAKRRLNRWCPPGSKVTVTPAVDVTPDPHKRLLASVTVDVGHRMVEDGFARRWH